MFSQFLVGAIATACNVAIHALIMAVVVWAVRRATARKHYRGELRLIGVMIAAVLVLTTAHAAEVLLWALTYLIVDAAPPGADRVYFAFVNYTTLGYGDVVPVKGWQLLGPITAMNGVLMFGWSTAVIFEVLRKTSAGDALALR
jgi:hypothetical protein